MPKIITIDRIQKQFKEQKVLTGVSLDVTRGSIYALLGANGSGKSTLLKIITGLLDADAGAVTVNQLDVKKDLRKIQRLFSFSAQNSTVDDVLTGSENLVLIAKLRHIKQPQQVANDLLAQFKLTAAANKRVADYSGGMRRRLDLAMSLVGDPEILFLDEPTTGLDPASRNDLWQAIRGLKQQGKTIFLTTQYLEEADQLADEIGFLGQGTIIASGTPAEMKHLAGPEKMTLVFTTPTEVNRAVPVLQAFRPQTLDEVTLTVVLTKSVTTSLQILSLLTKNDLQPVSFQVTAPTLDDVFLQLNKEA
ncbi:ABC transporter ATP-binding protein [Loigolactobacillus binensis]|uniref:ATP-binding cassette domain-containing protein n=1 Tax=Loigolactobacillus binensis TaxID=2559922 RepID=A0ABW3E9T2_9LACO|nr:ATP-binding cassette domain-containing protein [Loigolactobacillus binensis]